MISLHLKSNSGNISLKTQPIGWDEIWYAFKRSKDYVGITKEFLVDQLGFIKDGYEFLKNAYKLRGIEQDIKLEVYWENPNTFKNELFFTGRLDLTTYAEEDEVIYVDVEQSGFVMKFLNQDEIPIGLKSIKSLQGTYIPPRPLKELTLHSKVLKKSFVAGFESPYFVGGGLNTAIGSGGDTNIHIPLGFETATANEIDTVYNYPLSFVLDPSNIFEMMEIRESGVYEFFIDYYIRFLFSAGGRDAYLYSLDFQINDEPLQRLINEEWLEITRVGGNHPPPIYDTSSVTPYDINQMSNVIRLRVLTGQKFNFKVGDKIKMYLTIKTPEDLGQTNVIVVLREHPETLQKSVFKIVGDTVTPETTCLGQLPYETFSHVCESITDQTDIFESTLLGRTDLGYNEDGDASLYLCTDGKQIRKLPIVDYPLTFNFKDLFNSFDAKHNIGIGIEKRDGKEKIVLEKKEYFYKDVMIADLGVVTNIEKTIAIDYFHNTLRIGYEKFENEVVNGIDEINTEVQYSTPISQVKAEYKKLSPYRSDGYGIETARRLADKPTQDSKYDEDNFLINLLRDGESFITEKDSEFDYIQNIISPETIYNGRDTPSRMTRRHGSEIKAGLIHHNGESLRFTKGKANTKMISKMEIEGYQVKENADINIQDLPDPLIIPEFHSFSHPAKNNLVKLIEAEPYGYFKYTDKDGIEYKSFIEEVEFSKGEGKFKLLRKYGAES